MVTSYTAIQFVILSIIVFQLNNGYCSTIDRLDADFSVADEHIGEQCIEKCPDQDRTNSEHIQLGCGNDCYIKQYTLGCRLWQNALESTCKTVCNKTDQELLDPKELYCVMGCNDAVNRYFKWLKYEIGTPGAPALVADSLTATSLSLEWGIPEKLLNLTHGKTKTYLVQWRYEEAEGDWKFCRNQSIGDNSTIRVDNLQPYRKYRFRVALSLSPNYNDILIISQQSVIISTLPKGKPESAPINVRVVAVDHNRISVSWEPGPFPNGPILSYVLQIRDLAPFGYSAIKDIPASDNKNFYMYEKVPANRNYSIHISKRNAEGEGPPAIKYIATPKEPEVKDDEPQPILILGSDRLIFSQGSDLLSQTAVEFYSSEHRILGISIHISRKLIFVADEAGYIFQASLDDQHTPKREIVKPHPDVNFAPIQLSVDWLNNHLYILGHVTNQNAPNSWQISRCDLNGKGMTVALSGLRRKPDKIEVDPYNGYLFWVITGTTIDTGLFRLDLADISNGVKHDDKPTQLIKGNNLGAFAIDHARFRLLVPFQFENTIYSISLDGRERENIRNNTQKPQFKIVKSIAYANGLFYWTNGEDILTEDYHKLQDSYFHNNYYHQPNSSSHFICVNLTAAQPIPIPVNPPSKVQSLLSSQHARVSWRIPHLLGNQGKAAWQKWQYEVELFENKERKEVKYTKENTCHFDNLNANTQYTFRVAAYTSAGKGPWSQEFRSKSLRSSHERFFIIAANNGLFKSDVFGAMIHKIRKSDGDNRITDIAWFEDMYYIVENNTLKLYVMENNQLKKENEIESIESIAVDWVGRKLYWSNPSQQLITRANLNGKKQEPLSIVGSAREIKIDALRGYIYYSTGNAVYSCRLNGRNLTTYFMEEIFAGKQVMGLTLDMENQKIYWIVRSYGIKNYLYTAPLADMFVKDEYTKLELDEESLQGPLVYFSDRLMWIQSNNTITMADVNGKNLAHIKNNKFHGLKRIFVVDASQNFYPNNSKAVIVIPEPVNPGTIAVNSGDGQKFNISWDEIRNTNYGQVFYEVRIHTDTQKEYIAEFTGTNIEYPFVLAPYTEFRITIRVFTYWGSAVTHATLHSPTAPASPPTELRIYQTHNRDLFTDTVHIEVILRWAPPITPNGPILGYEIHYSFDDDIMQEQVISIEGQEKSFSDLLPNKIYNFQILCYSENNWGELSEIITIDTSEEKRIPVMLLAWQEQIFRVDLDLKTNASIINTGNQILHMTYLEREERIFWFNENYELFSYTPGSIKTKLLTANAKVLGLTIDWVERMLFWAELSNESSSSIQYLDLNRFTKERLFTGELFTINNVVEMITISPMQRKLFWLEESAGQPGNSELFFYDLDQKMGSKFYNSSADMDSEKCQSVVPFIENSESMIMWQNKNNLKMVNIETGICYLVEIEDLSNKHNFVKGNQYYYWIENKTIVAENENDDTFTYPLDTTAAEPESVTLLAFFKQEYPSIKCLIPMQRNQDYKASLFEATESSLTLELPPPQFDGNCSQWSHEVRYTIFYKLYEGDATYIDDEPANCGVANCSVVYSHTPLKKIEGLAPFSLYRIQIGLNNHYGEERRTDIQLGPMITFSTEPGAPSMPREINAEPISQTEVIVSWMPPEIINSKSVWYEIHWQTEHIVNSSKNKQQKLLSDDITFNDSTSTYTFVLGDLLPKQYYTIWIRAYSSDKTFSESNTVNILTYPEPKDMSLKLRTPTELEIDWQSPENLTKYSIQYSAIGSTNWATIFESGKGSEMKFVAKNLLPKTQYRFIVILSYPRSKKNYAWPSDQRFVFETLGDIPSSPGKPVPKQLKDLYFHVMWEPSKDNGADIEHYSLEALEKTKPAVQRVKRSTISSAESNYEDEDSQSEALSTETPDGVGSEDGKSVTIENQWVELYNGSEPYWVSSFPQPLMQYKFRVRAKNLYGWGPYSQESEPVTEPYIPDRSEILMLLSGIAIIAVIVLAVGGGFVICFRRKLPDKQLFSDAQTTYRSDVELAILRELPGNRIHTNSLLYNSGPISIASDIALLPQIRKDQIKMTVFLGSGAFGEVHEGIVQNVNGEAETRVAIKSLRKGASSQEKEEFLQEAHLMSNFKYEHILKLIGVCLDHDMLYIIMELMLGGDLQSYLRQNRPVGNMQSPLTLLDLISMCVDVASGCRYLEEMHFVHRDLAARNCLVSSTDPATRVVKIGDFGLARDIYKNDYYRKVGQGLLPVRWMSPESLMDGVYTSQSDIWSFGVLCWEIMTLGQQPYPARNNVEVLHFVKDGGRLGRPVDCPEELHQLMLKCWSYLPEDRPTFRECLEDLKLLQAKTSDSVQIVAEFPNKRNTGGIFNRSYLLPDANHTINNNNINIDNLNTDSFKLDNPVDSSRESGSISTIPKYLELVHDDDEEEEEEEDDDEISDRDFGGGYEIPINELMPKDDNNNSNHNNNINNGRTFSSSSTISNLSTPLNNIDNNFINNINRDVVIVDEFSSIDQLLPHNVQNILPHSKQNQQTTIGRKISSALYTNSQIDENLREVEGTTIM